MKNEPAISVIIPVYNVENYIEDCLESVRKQTFADLEIICVNDRSSDKSWEKVKAAAQTCSRFVLAEHTENRGLSAARNTGLQLAGGRYVYFLDSDDCIVPEAMERLYDLAENGSLDAVVFCEQKIYESPEMEERFRHEPAVFRSRYPEVLSGKELFGQWIENRDWMPLQQRYFYRRDFLVRNGLTFEEGMIHEDELFAFQMLMCAERVRAVPDPWFIRRYRAGSIMSRPVTFANVDGVVRILAGLAKARQDAGKDRKLHQAICTLAGKLSADVRGKAERAAGRPSSESFSVTGKDPFLSVVIPVYNTAPYLPECLDSVLSQSFRDFEVICVDDASDDGSGEILKQYAAMDPRIRLMENEKNSGQSVARNRALGKARGQYVYMLDADDFIVPDMFRSLREEISRNGSENPPDVIGFENRQFADTPEFEEAASRVLFTYENAEGDYSGRDAFITCVEQDILSPSVPTFLIRRDFLEKTGLRFEEGILHEDIGFIFEMLLRAENVRLLHRAYFCRRFRAHSTVTKGFGKDHALGYLKSWSKAVETEAEFMEAYGDAPAFRHARRKWIRDVLGRIRQLYYSSPEKVYLPAEQEMQQMKKSGQTVPDRKKRPEEKTDSSALLIEMLQETTARRERAEEIFGKEMCEKLESAGGVWLCGTGQYAHRVLEACSALDLVIKGVIAQEKEMAGRHAFSGFALFLPEQVPERDVPVILAVSHYGREEWIRILQQNHFSEILEVSF